LDPNKEKESYKGIGTNDLQKISAIFFQSLQQIEV
jgi:hypothetical protein